MSVQLQITEAYRIRTDPRNWILEYKQDPEKAPKGKACEDSEMREAWKAWGYYPHLSGAINGLYALELKQSDAETLEELREESQRILDEIAGGLGVEYKITVSANDKEIAG